MPAPGGRAPASRCGRPSMSASAYFPSASRHLAPVTDEVTVCATRDSVAALASEWGDLYRRSGGINPFASPEWVSSCFESVAAGAQPYVVALRSEGVLRGVAPLRLEGQLGFRVLRPA